MSPCIKETKSKKTFHTRDLFNTTQNPLLIQSLRLNLSSQPPYRILFLQTNSQTTISSKQREFRTFLLNESCWKIFIVDHIFQILQSFVSDNAFASSPSGFVLYINCHSKWSFTLHFFETVPYIIFTNRLNGQFFLQIVTHLFCKKSSWTYI